jgi:hypothetical protein
VTSEDVVVDVEVIDGGSALGTDTPGADASRVAAPRSGRRGRRTVLRLTWRPRDPLAVELMLTSTPDHPALPRGRWVVLRDFLRYGLEEPTGDGAVRISPDSARGLVTILLAREGRPAAVSVPCSAVQEFLDRAEAVLPSGEESSEEVLDALIEALLRA